MKRTLLIALLVVLCLVAGAGWLYQRHSYAVRLLRTDPDRPVHDPAAVALGRHVYAANCAACHGDKGLGDPVAAVPNLTDDDHLYGTGLTSEIEQIVTYGIRSGDRRGWDLASMPAFGTEHPYAREALQPLSPTDIADVTIYVRGLNTPATDPAAFERGAAIFSGRGACYDCHGADAKGDSGIGAPNLTDKTWLWGHGSDADIRRAVTHGLNGTSPAFDKRLSPTEIRAVSLYVSSLQTRAR